MKQDNRLPEPLCPVCFQPVAKLNRFGQRSYSCSAHWGPWSRRIWTWPQLKAAKRAEYLANLEPNGGNVYRAHKIQVTSGQFWRCAHGRTGLDGNFHFVGCEHCRKDDPAAAAKWDEALAKAKQPAPTQPQATKPGEPGHFGPHDGGVQLLADQSKQTPSCFGSNPGPQQQAENDCFTCSHQRACAAEGKTGKVVSENLSLGQQLSTNELTQNGKEEKGKVPSPSLASSDPFQTPTP